MVWSRYRSPSGKPSLSTRRKKTVLNIEVLHVQRVVFDELASRLHIFAHQRGKDGFGFGDVLEFDLEQRAALGIHGGLPELRGCHLAQPFITLHLVVAAPLFDDILEEFPRRLLFHWIMRGAACTLGSRLAGFGLPGGFAFRLFRVWFSGGSLAGVFN